MPDANLNRYAAAVWKWLWLIVICTAAAGYVGYRATQSLPPTYRTYTTLMVGDITANPGVSTDDLTMSQRLVTIYAGMILRQPVLDAAVKSLGLPTDWQELQDRVLVNHVEGSQVLEIRVTDADPRRAQATADEIARQLIRLSMASEVTRQLDERRQFVRRQLDTLQGKIQQAEAALEEKQAALDKEVSARGVMERQDEVRALELKINDWRSSYASLLTFYQGRAPSVLSVVEPASLPTEPVGPDVRANVLLAAVVGCLVTLAVVLVVESFDDTLGSEEDVRRVLAVPTLGSIGRAGRLWRRAKGVLAIGDPYSAPAEAYRVLRTNVQFASEEVGPLVLLVTSPGLGEGKTTTSANLAASFAQAGKRTILVDANLRRPSIHRAFGVGSGSGLTSLFLDEPAGPGEHLPGGQAGGTTGLRGQLEACLVPTGVPGLQLLPSGPTLAVNPAELFASARMRLVLVALRDLADVVVVDSPPVLSVADTAILAAMGVEVLLVAEARRTRRQAIRAANEVLLRAHARILGVVLNKAPRTAAHRAAYRYGKAKSERQRRAAQPEAGQHPDGYASGTVPPEPRGTARRPPG